MPDVDGRDHIADLAHEVGLQPALLVSVSQWVPASVAARLVQLADYPLDRLAERVCRCLFRNLRDIDAAQSYCYRPRGNVGNSLQ